MKRLLNEQDVHTEYGIPVPTLRSVRSRGGGIPFVKFGSRVYYRVEDIEGYLAANTVTATAKRAADGATRTAKRAARASDATEAV